MKHLLNFAIGVVLAVVVLVVPIRAMAADTLDGLVFLTENYAPFNYKKDGTAHGTTVDLLLKMFKQAGSSKSVKDIKVLPWARGYNLAQDTKNTVLFSTTRTETRENMFKWVGPVTPTKISVIARKDKHIKISKLEDLNAYKNGTVREDIGELLLKKGGIDPKNIQPTNSSASAAKMLAAGRIDTWAYEDRVALWNLKGEGFNPDDYEVVYVLEESQLYFAIQKDTDDALVAKLQAALDAVRAAEK